MEFSRAAQQINLSCMTFSYQEPPCSISAHSFVSRIT